MSVQEFDNKDFRRALGGFATGVTVVTTCDASGRNWGFTANSFTSVSLDPPLVLACIAKSAYSFPIYMKARSFAINILSEQQKDLASTFSRPVEDRFEGVTWRGEQTGSPILDDVVCWFDCEMHETVDAGDHVILIGRVVKYSHADVTPLGYCRGAYVSFGVAEEILHSSSHLGNLCVGVIFECEEKILLFSDDQFQSVALPTASLIGRNDDAQSLLGKLSRLGIDSKLPFVFAAYDSDGAQNVYYRDQISKSAQQVAESPDAHLYRWVAFDAIPWEQIADAAVHTMLTRYIHERSANEFGVYVGNAKTGEVHKPN